MASGTSSRRRQRGADDTCSKSPKRSRLKKDTLSSQLKRCDDVNDHVTSSEKRCLEHLASINEGAINQLRKTWSEGINKELSILDKKFVELRKLKTTIDGLIDRVGLNKDATDNSIEMDCQGQVIRVPERTWKKSEFLKVFIECNKADKVPQPWLLDQDPDIMRRLLWYMKEGDTKVFTQAPQPLRDRLERTADYLLLDYKGRDAKESGDKQRRVATMQEAGILILSLGIVSLACGRQGAAAALLSMMCVAYLRHFLPKCRR